MRVWGLATPQGPGKHNDLESNYVDDARSNHVVGFAETPRSLLAVDLPTLPLHTDPAARPRVPAVRWSLGLRLERRPATTTKPWGVRVVAPGEVADIADAGADGRVPCPIP